MCARYWLQPYGLKLCPFGGLQGTNPFTTLRKRKEEGLKLIVVDPRRSELATQADIHLQIRPGEDPTLLATFINIILTEGLHDHEFCERWVEKDHLELLADATKAFTAELAAKRCGVAEADIVKAANYSLRAQLNSWNWNRAFNVSVPKSHGAPRYMP